MEGDETGLLVVLPRVGVGDGLEPHEEWEIDGRE
jgi:hypothetical protein